MSARRRRESPAVLLVLMGATSEGKKELLAVVEGYRESEQSWADCCWT